MIKTIPEKKIYICDVCGKEEPHHKMEALFVIKRHALNHLGDPAANGDHSFDACDDCHNQIVNVINKTIKEIGENNEH